MARPVLPTDLLALVSHNGRVYPNAAETRERLGASEASTFPLESAFERWLSFVTSRNAWISARHQRLQGLVSTRRRGGHQAWEIDCLIDTTKALDAVPGLLDCATAEAGRSGVEKLFLRLAAESVLLPVLRKAGFQPYTIEVLYARQAPAAGPSIAPSTGSGQSSGGTPEHGASSSEFAPVPLRAFSPQDHYPAYRLYNSVVPESVRRHEAATFGEWHAAQERRWLKNGVQLVAEREGRLTAWLRAASLPQGTLIDLLLEDGELAQVESHIISASEAAGGHGPQLALVPQCSVSLGRRLEEVGFEPQAQFVSLVHRTAKPVKLPKLVPAIGKTAPVT